jgi:GDP-4-dehydro-6-deoxy-D-mannose reductase
MKAFITGIPGFAGSHLAENLLKKGYKVYGTCLPGENQHRLDGFQDDLMINPLDFQKPDILPKMLDCVKPDYIFHLAAQPSVARSFKYPLETYQINLMGSYYLLEAARKLSGLKGLLMVTSSDIYGVVKPKDQPLNTDQRFQPVSPYGVSKAACDMMGYQYFKNYGLPVVRARAFNHSGPRQSLGFIVPDLCSQIAVLENSRRKRVVKIGNQSAKRDISDVRDIVNGYRLVLEKGKPGEVYHLCTGKAHRISVLFNKLKKMSSVDFEVKIDSKLARPSEVPVLIGDATKAEKKLGYKRNYTIDDTLKDCLEYYRSLQGGKSDRSSK